MAIYKDKQTGELVKAYARMSDEYYEPAKASGFVKAIDASDVWDVVDADVYTDALDAYGLDVKAYEYPEDLWDDFMTAYKAKGDKYI